MIDDWLKEIDNKKIVVAALLDFSVTFDIIDHNLLLTKLMFYGFATSAVLWSQSYLFNRTQRVFFNGSFSNVKHVKCGVPQGSSLGPLLKACVSMIADDSTVYASATTANEVNETLNKELQSVLEWVASNKLVLNIFKVRALYLVQIIPSVLDL